MVVLVRFFIVGLIAVLLSIGFSYYYELVLKQPNPIHPDYMISGIPKVHEIITNIPKPNFNFLGTFDFWIVVLSLTLIASIESLLSIKGLGFNLLYFDTNIV